MALWKLDPEHTVAEFSARHMMVTWVHGQFNKVSGQIRFDPEDIAATRLEAEIDASVLYTGVARRDDHLRSEDFLDVARHPVITFRSTAAQSAGLDHFKLFGDLTIRGTTRPIVLDVRWAGPNVFEDDDKTNTAMGFRATAEINREDFGLTWNMEFGKGSFMVGKHLFLTLNAEADLVEE